MTKSKELKPGVHVVFGSPVIVHNQAVRRYRYRDLTDREQRRYRVSRARVYEYIEQPLKDPIRGIITRVVYGKEGAVDFGYDDDPARFVELSTIQLIEVSYSLTRKPILVFPKEIE